MHEQTHSSLFWGILSINCICLSGMSVWTRSFSLPVGFPLLSVLKSFWFCACSQSLLLFRFSCLSFPAHIASVQEVSPVANIPKFLSTYTVFLPLEAWDLLENGKCLFMPWVQNTVKTRERPNIFSLQSYSRISDSSGKAVRGWLENCPGVLGTNQSLYQCLETRSKVLRAPE